MLLGTTGDAIHQQIALDLCAEDSQIAIDRVVTVPASAEGGEGPTGQLDDLERPGDAPAVEGVHSCGGVGILLGQSGEGCGDIGLDSCLHGRANRGVGRRELQRVDDRAEVQARSTDQEDRDAVCPQRLDRCPGPRLEPLNGAFLLDVEQVDHVVWDRCLLHIGGLGRSDVHTAIDGESIDGHDRGVGSRGRLHCQPGLARTGRTDECDEWCRHRRGGSSGVGPSRDNL